MDRRRTRQETERLQAEAAVREQKLKDELETLRGEPSIQLALREAQAQVRSPQTLASVMSSA